MQKIKLGKTELLINKDGLGCLPLQRMPKADAVKMLQKALEAGIDFYDTSRVYTDSEEKMAAAFAGKRQQVVLASKTMAKTGAALLQDLDESLRQLGTDVIDVYQFHNPEGCPQPGGEDGLYDAAQKARQQGKVRYIGITSHRLPVARQALESGLYHTIQYPFSYLSTPEEEQLVRDCAQKQVGFIAMKALAGGLLTDVAASRAWLCGFEGAVPIWGLQSMAELDALLSAMEKNEGVTPAARQRIEADRAELAGEFCRSCGYCMPCPAGIEIRTCARLSLFMRRAPGNFYTPEWRAKMAQINMCIGCGKCGKRCPYGLDPLALMRKNHEEYIAGMPD